LTGSARRDRKEAEVELVGFLSGSHAHKAVIAREDWPLLVIAASDGLLPLQLQKSLLVLAERFPELKSTGFYEFRLIGGGHFSEQIYTDADDLAKKGLVSIRFSEKAGSRQYRVTAAGAERAKKLEKLMRPELAQSLRKLVAWISTRSMDQLLRSTAPAAAIRPDPAVPDPLRSR
jgi:hypothetical protein